MIALLGSVLLASLLGSPHCAGMCGGLVALCGGVGRGRASLPALAAYHASRLASYAATGAVAGAVGMALDLGGAMVGVQRIAAVAAGVAIALVGVGMLLRLGGLRTGCLPLPPALARAVARVHAFALARGAVARSLVVGAATPLLPCGWLWAFAAIAAGTASPLLGALVMAAFWLGTVPILSVLSVGIGSIPAEARRSLAALAAAAMIAAGIHVAAVRSAGADQLASDLLSRIRRGERDLAAEGDALGAGDDRPACCREASP